MTKNSKITLLILIVILLGLLIFYYSFKSESPPLTPIDTGLTEIEKENAARIMNEKLKNVPPLTDKQKEDIAKEMTQSLPE